MTTFEDFLELKENYAREAYAYYSANISPINTIIVDGHMRVVDGGHNDVIDAPAGRGQLSVLERR